MTFFGDDDTTALCFKVVHKKSVYNFVIYVDLTVGQFLKRLASTIAVRGGHVEHLNIVFNMTTLQRNDRRCAITV